MLAEDLAALELGLRTSGLGGVVVAPARTRGLVAVLTLDPRQAAVVAPAAVDPSSQSEKGATTIASE